MAHELAVEAIVAERPDAIIVQGESMEHFHPAGETAAHEAQRLNGLKLLSLDLTLGHELNPGMAGYLHRHGVTSSLATTWLADQWRDVLALRATGVPITGFTWSPLTDPVDEYNDVHAIGLYDLKRRIRPVGQAHQALIARWKPVLAVVAELELDAKVLRA
jgi:hypothetical protein